MFYRNKRKKTNRTKLIEKISKDYLKSFLKYSIDIKIRAQRDIIYAMYIFGIINQDAYSIFIIYGLE